jgi:hypothetical protein
MLRAAFTCDRSPVLALSAAHRFRGRVGKWLDVA